MDINERMMAKVFLLERRLVGFMTMARGSQRARPIATKWSYPPITTERERRFISSILPISGR